MGEGEKRAASIAVPTPEELGFDPAEIRQRYAAERAKRLREDGNDQYLEVAGAFERNRLPNLGIPRGGSPCVD